MSNDFVPHHPSDDAGPADPAINTSLLADLTGAAAADDAPESAEPAAPSAPSFEDMKLSPEVHQALEEMGYFTPTPVQSAVYASVAAGKDVVVQSRTGTGKTAAFGLPILERLDPALKQVQALVLTPTRELAIQVSREIQALGKFKGVSIQPIYGGAPIGKQIEQLREGVHIVIGTPGRVLDHIGRRTFDTRHVRTFVLDECDEMLSMGFLEDIERVVSHLPKDKQTALFSATMPDEVSRFARRAMKDAEKIALSDAGVSVADISHAYYIVSGVARTRDLLKIIITENPESAIIFCNTRDETAMVARFLQKQGLDAEPISSDLSQNERERVMQRMRDHNLRFLVATDVAARGIDITDLTHVINFTFPESAEVYVHRTGRTGRAGKKGTALSLIGPRELGSFYFLKLMYKIIPEEKVLPPASILEGVLKVSTMHVGAPPPPDPVEILTAAVTGAPSAEQAAVVKKVLASPEADRVIAMLITEKLAAIAQAKKDAAKAAAAAAEAARPARDERFEREERPRYGRDDERPRYGREGRDGRDDRPRFSRDDRPREDRPAGEERPRFSRDDRPREDRPAGEERPRFSRDDRPRDDRPREDRPAGEERPRFSRDDRPRDDRPRFSRDDRPRRDRDDRPRDDRPRDDRPRDDRPVEARDAAPRDDRPVSEPRPAGEERPRRDDWRANREDRPRRDRDDRPRRDRDDRPREDRPVEARDAAPSEPAAVEAVREDRPVETAREDRPVEAAREDRPVEAAREDRPVEAAREDRPRRDRDDRGPRRDRDGRGPRRDRDDRGPRTDRPVEAREPREDVPAVAAAPEVRAEAAPEVRAEPAPEPRRKRGSKNGAIPTPPPADSGREFWETWAEEKSTRPAPAPAPVAAREERPARAERPAREDRPAREGGRRERGGRDRDRAPTADERPAARAVAAEDPGSLVRLYVSLGKEAGVTADDVRALLGKELGDAAARIGSVAMRATHCYVRVPEDLVERIVETVNGTRHNDVDVKVELARA